MKKNEAVSEKNRIRKLFKLSIVLFIYLFIIIAFKQDF